MKYLRIFNTFEEYQSNIDNLHIPNVSAIRSTETVFFHPESDDVENPDDDKPEYEVVVNNNILKIIGTTLVNNNMLSITYGSVENNILIL